MTIIYDQYGIPRKSDHIQAVYSLFTLKEKHQSNPWPVIEQCFKIFEETHPKHYQSHLIYIDDIRETRRDKKFASTKDKTTGGYLRYTLDIPDMVMKMIRTLYSPDELPMNREFYRAFAKKFPNYKVAEKL